MNVYVTKLLKFSLNIFELILRIYPQRYRLKYENDLLATFTDYCLFTFRESGLAGMVMEVFRNLFDLFVNALEKRVEAIFGYAIDLTSGKGGQAAILGSLLSFMLGWNSSGEEYEKLNFLTVIVPALFLAAQIDLGKRLRRGTLNTLWIPISLSGVVLWAYSWFVMSPGISLGWVLFEWGWILQSLSLIVLGLSVIHNEALENYSFIPVGLGFAGLISVILAHTPFSGNLMPALSDLFGASYLAGWSALGLAMLNTNNEAINTRSHIQTMGKG